MPFPIQPQIQTTSLPASSPTTALLTLLTTNLTALSTTLSLLPNQRAPIVLRAWRAVQTAQLRVRSASASSLESVDQELDLDLEELAHWVRWAKGVVAQACQDTAVDKTRLRTPAIQPSMLAEREMARAVTGSSAIHLGLLVEREETQLRAEYDRMVAAWKKRDAEQKVRDAERKMRELEWKVQVAEQREAERLERELEREEREKVRESVRVWLAGVPDWRSDVLGLKTGPRVRPVGLGIDIVEMREQEQRVDEEELFAFSDTEEGGVALAKRFDPASEALWKEVWVAAEKMAEEKCARAARAMAEGVDVVLGDEFVAHVRECDRCFDKLVGP